jgi:hypothetical protein
MEEYVGMVSSLWIANGQFFAHVNWMERSIVHPFYGMRLFIKTHQTCAVRTTVRMIPVIFFQINADHNLLNPVNSGYQIHTKLPA